MALDRMELADIGSPERLAQAIHQQAPEMPIPMPVEDIALQLDIIDITALETDGFEGGLLTDENKSQGIILFNEASPRRRRRFTIGHELGHFLCPWHKPPTESGFLCSAADLQRSSATESDRAAQMEVEANRFSAELLLPASRFRTDLRRRSGPELEVVFGLADRYDTSVEATARRFVELHHEPSAIIISHHGTIRRMYRAASFPFIDARLGQTVPHRTLSTRADLVVGSVSDLIEVDAAAWLPSGRGLRAPILYEQVACQANGYRVTFLTIDPDDDTEEESDLEEAWTPRFPRR